MLDLNLSETPRYSLMAIARARSPRSARDHLPKQVEQELH